MAQYDVYVFCNDCSDSHPMGIRLPLDDGPVGKDSIGNLYAGKELPQNIVNLVNNYVYCPKTKKQYVQKDNNQVFLVAVAE